MAFLLMSTLSACLCGYCGSRKILEILDKSKYRRSINACQSSGNILGEKRILVNEFFKLAQRESARAKLGTQKMYAKGLLRKDMKFDKYKILAGLDDRYCLSGFCEARLKLSIVLLILGGVFGFVISAELSFLLAIAGGIYGFVAPDRWLEQTAKMRVDSLEHHLPEMLDVFAICMQSGLSFDRSLEIYSESFNTHLSHELTLASRMWKSGLKTREDALRDIASAYDSIIFNRIIEMIIRALNLGSSMAEGFRDASREARVVYRAKREEEVAKAPVKMMIPTGTLILPAMLLLVLGPVLLELSKGGL